MDIEGFHELSDELQDLSTRFDDMKDRRSEAGSKLAISDGIERGMEDEVVPLAKDRVPVRTGRLRDSIDYENDGWSGETLTIRYGSTLDEEYARVQEFGTRKSSYLIRPNGDYPLSFYWREPPGRLSPRQYQFAYVYHPGVDVPQPGPMQSALKDTVDANVFDGYVGNEMKNMMDKIFD